MAAFLSTVVCPLAILPTTTSKVKGSLCQFNKISTTGGLSKNIPKILFSKAANGASTRSRSLRTAISCSAQPETLQTVQSTIAKQLSIDVSTVAPGTKFADLGANSLDTVEIMMALEEQFGVSMGEGGAENIATVQEAADLIEKVKAAAA